MQFRSDNMEKENKKEIPRDENVVVDVWPSRLE